MISRWIVALVLVLLFNLNLGCSSCRNFQLWQVAATGRSDAIATLSTRECGSVEGWIVKVRAAEMPEEEVFRGVMPPPISVSDLRTAVSVKWKGASELVVITPTWIQTTLVRREFGPIRITYEPNDVPYPRE